MNNIDYSCPFSYENNMAYAMLTTRCNLTCPYCDIKSADDGYDQEKFMQALRDFNGWFLLFGGEPTLYRDRLKHVMFSDPEVSNKIKSITTNLMILDDELMDIFKNFKSLATSWNPSRFRNNEYSTWLDHINKIDGQVKFLVIITMTNELLQMDPDEIINTIRSWNSNTINIIGFEHYVGPETTQEYFDKCDDLLCEIYKRWDVPIRFKNVRMQLGYRYNFYCKRTHVITPSGILLPGCPQRQYNEIKTPSECYSCDRVDVCKPCRLQNYCSYPKKFAELINNDSKPKGV